MIHDPCTVLSFLSLRGAFTKYLLSIFNMNEEKFCGRQRAALSGSLVPHLPEQELLCGRWDTLLDRIPGVSGNGN